MKSGIALSAVLMALTGQPANASQSACTFEGGKAPRYYELEFIGYGDVNPVIVFSSTAFASGQRIRLQPENYLLRRFSQKLAVVELDFRNPGVPSLPPSFRLSGHGGKATLMLGTGTVSGLLNCAR